MHMSLHRGRTRRRTANDLGFTQSSSGIHGWLTCVGWQTGNSRPRHARRHADWAVAAADE